MRNHFVNKYKPGLDLLCTNNKNPIQCTQYTVYVNTNTKYVWISDGASCVKVNIFCQ